MDIFVDSAGKSGQDDGPSEWAELGSRDARRKENTIESTPWKGETMPQKGAAPRTPKPEVFKDVVSAYVAKHQSLVNLTDNSRDRTKTPSDQQRKRCSSRNS
jgi:checkpoint serine/threonine-protein kinase